MTLMAKIDALVLSFVIAPGVTAPPVDADRQTRLRCGSENAAYRPEPNAIQCLDKHGRPTITVAVPS